MSRWARYAIASSVTYNDSPSGTVTASGTLVENKAGSDSQAGTVTASGSRTESWSNSTSPAGTVVSSGSRTESWSGSATVTGSATAGGTIVEHWTGPTVAPSGGASDDNQGPRYWMPEVINTSATIQAKLALTAVARVTGDDEEAVMLMLAVL